MHRLGARTGRHAKGAVGEIVRIVRIVQIGPIGPSAPNRAQPAVPKSANRSWLQPIWRRCRPLRESHRRTALRVKAAASGASVLAVSEANARAQRRATRTPPANKPRPRASRPAQPICPAPHRPAVSRRSSRGNAATASAETDASAGQNPATSKAAHNHLQPRNKGRDGKRARRSRLREQQPLIRRLRPRKPQYKPRALPCPRFSLTSCPCRI